MSNYNKNHYMSQKRLLDMPVGTFRPVEISYKYAKYETIKSLASQLKKAGKGIWHVHKGIVGTIITREK